MAEHGADEHQATVEWGEADERRTRWWERIVGREADPLSAARRSERSPARISTPAVTCAALGFVFLVAAQMLPWMDVTGVGNVATELRSQFGGSNVSLAQLNSWEVLAYSLGWMLLLPATCVALVAAPAVRRFLVAAGVGLGAAQLAVLAGLAGTVKRGGGVFGPAIAGNAPVSYGDGFYAAFVGLLFLMAAIVLAGWRPRRRPAAIVEEEEVADADETVYRGPADLTVTPIGPAGADGSGPWSGR